MGRKVIGAHHGANIHGDGKTALGMTTIKTPGQTRSLAKRLQGGLSTSLLGDKEDAASSLGDEEVASNLLLR